MNPYVAQASKHIRLQEGPMVIERILIECYLNPGVSTKGLARAALIPTPVAAAVKKELIRTGALVQDRGARCTPEGRQSIEREWGYAGLQRDCHRSMLLGREDTDEWRDILSVLQQIFPSRPQVNVQIDQSSCTPETSLRRAVLALQHHTLIGKQILCIGDDDLVSISIGLLLHKLFPSADHAATSVHVVDIDERFIGFIRGIATELKLPIVCYHHDVRDPLPPELRGRFDCFYTDPPYTLPGMNLFLSRGIHGLKQVQGLPIFLSFAHKSPEVMLAMQREFVRKGLTISANYPSFNVYEGAELIANRSQMFVLRTTDFRSAEIAGRYPDAIYTGEIKRTVRIYSCTQCKQQVTVGVNQQVATIEKLKNAGCPRCNNDDFELIARKSC
ncbi:putative methyltransferase [Paenibacillus ihbetae]|uniref:Putative methyltransferase n=1 Tax=Paenibacillus ihbetae TaxID=1870820 RepID=A0A1B2DUB3_9BACL|nr:bis-aminopropyl spermidine synthase family protein [Paenibacillus ihbetae]ANY71302.1 putative methyltransferase [Paenibacillus ihbetae]